jgi:hypothetical protein
MAPGNADVNIYVKGYVDLSEMKTAVKNFEIFAKDAKKAFTKGLQGSTGGGFTPDKFINVSKLEQFSSTAKKSFEGLGQPLTNFKKDVVVSEKVIQQGISGLNNAFKKMDAEVVRSTKNMASVATKNMGKISKAVAHVTPQFQGWAMSIMFAGMLVKQVMNSIWQSTSKTFNDVMHSVEGNVTSFDKLNGSMTYLGFVMGEALAPIAEWLVPIIDMIAEWVVENDKLAAGLFVVATVFGTLSFLIGSAVLAFAGFAEAWVLMGPAIIAAGKAIGAFFAGLASTVGLPVIAVIALIVAAVLALVVMWRTNFGGIRDFVGETFAIIWNTIKGVFANIFGIFSGIWKILKGLFTGDFELIWEGIIDILQNAGALILKTLFGLGAAIINIFIFVGNMVSDGLHNTQKLVLGIIRGIIEAYNKIPFLENIDTTFLTKIIDKTEQAKVAARAGYMTGDKIMDQFGGIDAMFGLNKQTPATSSTVDNSTNIGQLTVNMSTESDNASVLIQQFKKLAGG